MRLKLKNNLIKKFIFNSSKFLTEKILQLKNTHKGQSCYIFGDGISIKWFNLSAFPKKITFVLGKILSHKEANFLNIKYVTPIEPYWFYPYLYNYSGSNKLFWKNKIQVKYREWIKQEKDISFFINLSNYPVIRNNNIYFVYRAINDPDFKFGAECILNNEEITAGSFKFGLALAIYMGFTDIILVGCDYTHKQSRSHHWFERGKGILKSTEDYCHNYFNIAQKYAKITTITIDGEANFLPSTTYKDFTGYLPTFRENHELLDHKTMELYASLEDYKIF
jgi:hypothetical protein